MPQAIGVNGKPARHSRLLDALTAILLFGVADAGAADLRDFFKDLYGPDGIHLQPTPPPFPSHEPHFSVTSLQGLDTLNSAIAASVTTLSPSAAVGGFTFDVELGVPLPTTEPLGPILAERARTIGRSRLNIAVTYTQVRYDKFEGTDLEDLSLTFQHEDTNGDGILGPPLAFEADTIVANLDTTIEQDIVGLFATYGITDRWDVGLVVPLQRIAFDVTSRAVIQRNSGAISSIVHNFGPNSSPSTPTVSSESTIRAEDEASGIGDILLRTKYNFLLGDAQRPDMAIVGRLRLPTGDEADLLGTGETSLAAIFVVSKVYGRFEPHLNLGYEASTAGSSENIVHYVAGVEGSLSPRVTATADVIGLFKPKGTGVGDHLVDLALGVKLNPFRSFIVGGNVSLPLNRDEGLRADAIWTIGAEYTF
jgi:hypothetical protein